ncbi:hypothetical protein ABZX51_009405 [Aspergillus tubingensis]
MSDIPNTKLSKDTNARRPIILKDLTEELLERRVFQLLLSPLQDEAKITQRNSALHALLESAADYITYTEGGMYGNSNVDRLPDLPAAFHYDSETMTPHSHHFTSYHRTPRFAPLAGGAGSDRYSPEPVLYRYEIFRPPSQNPSSPNLQGGRVGGEEDTEDEAGLTNWVCRRCSKSSGNNKGNASQGSRKTGRKDWRL